MLDREFFLGFVKIHILYHASKCPVSGVEMTEELKRHGYSLGPGTLYPALHRLEREGYLKLKPEVIRGKVRKYYTITEHGSQVLREASKKIRELVDEVLNEPDRKEHES